MSKGEDRPDLRETTLTGVRSIAGARLVAELTALASVVVLARLISPAEFGHAAIALVFVGVATILGPLGLTAIVVQRPVLSPREVESAAFLSLSLGAALTAATVVFSTVGVAATLFGDRTADLVALASPAFLLVGLGAVPQALVQRELRFRRLGVFEATSVVAGAVTAVSLALFGLEGESLVVGGVVVVGSTAVLAMVAVPLVRPRPSREGIRDVSGFATPVTLSSLVYLGFRNVDYVILGARLSPAQVGFYWRAYQLGVEYQGKLTQIMMRVSFPVYSRAEGVAELKRLRLRIVRTHATVILPLLAGFIAVAPALIPWLFGEAWEPAVVPAQILAVAGMAEAVTTGIGFLMIVLGRPGLLLAWNVLTLVAYGVMIAFLAQYGLTWVSIGVAVFSVVSVVVLQAALMPMVIDLGIVDFWHDVKAGVITAAIVLPPLVGGRVLLEDIGVPVLPLLGLLTLVGTAIIAAVLRVLFGEVWNDLLVLCRRVSGRGTPIRRET